MYIYIENHTVPMTFSVGCINGNVNFGSGYVQGDEPNDWFPDITTTTRQEAAERVAYLNGGALPTMYRELNYVVVVHPGRMPRLVGVPTNATPEGSPTNARLVQRARKILKGFNSDMPKASKHLCRVYHLQWKHGRVPVIQDFMAEDLDSELPINPIKLPAMEDKDIHWKELDV